MLTILKSYIEALLGWFGAQSYTLINYYGSYNPIQTAASTHMEMLGWSPWQSKYGTGITTKNSNHRKIHQN
jgi:hypothetical protein